MIVGTCRVWIRVSIVLVAALGVPFGSAAQTAVQPQAAAQKPEPPPDFINPDRPGIADGSNVVGRRHFQFELGVQQEFRKDSGVSTRSTFIPTLLRFGIDDRWEAGVEGNNVVGEGIEDNRGILTLKLEYFS